MAHIHTYKSSFTAGEVSAELSGRGDLTAYENGAGQLENIFVLPTGGIKRRAGLRYVDTVPGNGRLVAFEFNTEQVYLLVFRESAVDVYENGIKIETISSTPWTLTQIQSINWVQSADTLLVMHPDVQPKKITRNHDGEWSISSWSYYEKDGAINQPFHKFSGDDVTLAPSATTGTITLTASADVFDAVHHIGVRFRLQGKQVEITAVASALSATAVVKETLQATSATKDWDEQAFSSLRGWPISACFHQDRLAIGGSRDLPNRLWMSKSADLFNFDLGTGLDDEAIEFAILSDQVNAVRHVFSGRHLQVFTQGAEWIVTGDPLTPTNIQLKRQTRVGALTQRTIPPCDVDGATLFISRAGDEIREFLYADIEQAYQAGDLATVSRHMMSDPVDMDYDKSRRHLHIVLGNGTLSTLTLYRREKVAAWSRQTTDGAVRSIALVDRDAYVLVERNGAYLIEIFDDDFHTDAGMKASDVVAKTDWSGLDHMEGKTVKVIGDGTPMGDFVVNSGAVSLDVAVSSVQVGLAFAHIIEPLPAYVATTQGGSQGGKLRPVAFTFRLYQTAALYLDVGTGLQNVPFKRFGDGMLDQPPSPYTGDKTVRAFGWRAGGIEPLWRIEQDTPVPFTLLSVVSEISVNS